MARKEKIGQGSLKAFARQGFKELSHVIPAFKDSVQVQEEPGVFGNPTQQDISRETGATDRIRETYQKHQAQPEPELEP